VRTLVEHPSSMTHAPIPVEKQLEAGIEPGLVRLSIGLETPADILRDLRDAFAAAGALSAAPPRNAGRGRCGVERPADPR
jgi:O-acetylhomoserine (thiol)-lyase